MASPVPTAQAAISARELIPSFPRMLETCTEAVLVEMNRRLATSPLLRPSATSWATSRSLGVSGPAPRRGTAPARPARQQLLGCPRVRLGLLGAAEGHLAARGAELAVGAQWHRPLALRPAGLQVGVERGGVVALGLEQGGLQVPAGGRQRTLARPYLVGGRLGQLGDGPLRLRE